MSRPSPSSTDPPGTQAVIYREGETLGSFILEGEHYGLVVFLDDLVFFRIPVQHRNMTGCNMTVFKSAEDFQFRSIPQKSAEKVLISFIGDFSKLPPPQQDQGHVPGHRPFCGVPWRPLLDISKMHKEDNIQVAISTPRASLVLEEKEARDQPRRDVEFHEMFQQVASFLSRPWKSFQYP